MCNPDEKLTNEIDISNDKSNKFSNSVFQADIFINDINQKLKIYNKDKSKQIEFVENDKEYQLERNSFSKNKKEDNYNYWRKNNSKADSSFKKSNFEYTVIKAKISQNKIKNNINNFSKTNSLMKSQSNRFMNSTLQKMSKERNSDYSDFSENNTDYLNFFNFNNLNQFNSGTKTLTTENDFRMININTIKGILNEKNKDNNCFSNKKSYKPDFSRFKFPDVNQKTDLKYEKIKEDANKRGKSSQIKNKFDCGNNNFQKFILGGAVNNKVYLHDNMDLKFKNFAKTGTFPSPKHPNDMFLKNNNSYLSRTDKKIATSELSKMNAKYSSKRKDGFVNMASNSISKENRSGSFTVKK